MSAPVAIDLFCGLGGWTEGLLAEGYEAWGYDIEAHEYGDEKYPGKLHLADVKTLHGSQFAHAALIVASPPCQEFSYMAMPWTRAKAKAAAIRADETGEALEQLTALFDACFRIQREACAAAGRYIPMVVENVRGAQPWVGRAAWNFGSYYLWGDVPALMPKTLNAQKNPGFRFDGSGRSFQSESVAQHVKGPGAGWFNDAKRNGGTETGYLSQSGSKSPARKAASAQIAKIPFALSSWIARTYYPARTDGAER
jgi:hypothetical protein